MRNVSIRDLRNRGGRVVDRVISGETLVVTRSGRPVAELRPVTPRPLDREELLARWRGLPTVDPETLRRDIDQLLDPAL